MSINNTNSAVANNETSIIARMASALKVEPAKLWQVLSKTCFRVREGQRAFSNEEIMLVLMVSEQLGLNPLRREIWAFRGKDGGVMPIVSIDGWKCIMHRQPSFDGYLIRYSDEKVEIGGRLLPEYCECEMRLKTLAHPIIERVYTEEVYMTTPVWSKRPRQMLHHRALIQAIRFAFPISGIADEGAEEAESASASAGAYVQPQEAMLTASASAPQLEQKPLTLSKQKLDTFAQKAILMAQERGDWAPAYAFAQRLDAESRAYIERKLEAAQAQQAQAEPEVMEPDVDETAPEEVIEAPEPSLGAF